MEKFKPFQKVVVYSEETGLYFPDIYQRVGNDGHYVLGCRYLIPDSNIAPYPKENGEYKDPDEIEFDW